MQNMLRTVTGVESYRGYMDFLIYLCRGRLTNKEMPAAFLCLKMVGEGEERKNEKQEKNGRAASGCNVYIML